MRSLLPEPWGIKERELVLEERYLTLWKKAWDADRRGNVLEYQHYSLQHQLCFTNICRELNGSKIELIQISRDIVTKWLWAAEGASNG